MKRKKIPGTKGAGQQHSVSTFFLGHPDPVDAHCIQSAHDQAADKAEVSVDAALHKCMWIEEEG